MNRMDCVEKENLKNTIRRLQRIVELRNEEIKILEEQMEDKMLENQMLRNSNSKSLYDSVCSKLDNVTQKLSSSVKLEMVEEFAKSYGLENEWTLWYLEHLKES